MEIEFNNVSPKLKEWLSDSDLKLSITTHIVDEFKKFTDQDFAKDFHQYINRSDTVPNDFLYKIVEVDQERKLVTSIRFKGGDKLHPFVEIVSKNFDIRQQEWPQIAKLVGNNYKLFQPLSIRFFDGLDTISNENSEFTFDQWYLANQLSTLKNYKTGFNQDKFEFHIPADISFYENYEKAFQQLVEAGNDEEVLVQLESKESIQILVDKQLVICIYYDNEWAGFIAVDQINYKYFKGYCVMEEILLEEYKGKGLGKALQRKMIEHLPFKDSELFYGTIDHKNIPSIKTALANGRQKIGKYVFCKIS